MRFHLISFRSSLGLLSHRPSRAPRWRDRQGHPPIDLRRQFQVRPGYHNPRARQDRAFRPHGRRKYHVGDPRPSDCETAKDDVWTEHGRAVQACDPARRSAPSHGCRRSMRQTSDGPECGLRKSPFLMSRDRDAIRSASSLQGTCQFPDKARCRKTRFHHNVDDRQRLLHRPCRLRMTAARLASEISSGGPMPCLISRDASGSCPRARSAARQLARMPGQELIKVPSRSRRTEQVTIRR